MNRFEVPEKKNEGEIFISYRRKDQPDLAGRISDRLKLHFENVFFDTADIEYGTKISDKILRELNSADILLAIIGPNWFGVDRSGLNANQIDAKEDWVRREVQESLQRKDMIKLPVLLNDTQMPRQGLPENIKELSQYRAFSFRSDHIEQDTLKLIETIKNRLDQRRADKLIGRVQFLFHQHYPGFAIAIQDFVVKHAFKLTGLAFFLLVLVTMCVWSLRRYPSLGDDHQRMSLRMIDKSGKLLRSLEWPASDPKIPAAKLAPVQLRDVAQVIADFTNANGAEAQLEIDVTPPILSTQEPTVSLEIVNKEGNLLRRQELPVPNEPESRNANAAPVIITEPSHVLAGFRDSFGKESHLEIKIAPPVSSKRKASITLEAFTDTKEPLFRQALPRSGSTLAASQKLIEMQPSVSYDVIASFREEEGNDEKLTLRFVHPKSQDKANATLAYNPEKQATIALESLFCHVTSDSKTHDIFDGDGDEIVLQITVDGKKDIPIKYPSKSQNEIECFVINSNASVDINRMPIQFFKQVEIAIVEIDTTLHDPIGTVKITREAVVEGKVKSEVKFFRSWYALRWENLDVGK
jgi:hypothetical protein